ncbi:ThuA domain-containing protein [Falsiroseomonas sp. HW251]|uniref:ThuA domain-containing protein n=1 Tax=Falsiroseomonas sp. HW251 TaxID=3390998 RepID=UPI003D3194D1
MTKQALIVWGGWPGHEPAECATIVGAMLREEGFDVAMENTTEAYADPALPRFDLIVPMVTCTIAKEEVEGLSAGVRSGVGMGGFHGQMADSFRNEVKYQFIVGGQWVAHPGNIVDYRITITRPDDPIMQAIQDFPYRSEQYFYSSLGHVASEFQVSEMRTILRRGLLWAARD